MADVYIDPLKLRPLPRTVVPDVVSPEQLAERTLGACILGLSCFASHWLKAACVTSTAVDCLLIVCPHVADLPQHLPEPTAPTFTALPWAVVLICLVAMPLCFSISMLMQYGHQTCDKEV